MFTLALVKMPQRAWALLPTHKEAGRPLSSQALPSEHSLLLLQEEAAAKKTFPRHLSLKELLSSAEIFLAELGRRDRPLFGLTRPPFCPGPTGPCFSGQPSSLLSENFPDCGFPSSQMWGS